MKGASMNDDYGNDYVTIIDDEGNEFELEHLDTIEIDEKLYMAFVPADMDEEEEDFGLVILKVVTRGEEELFETVDDEEELNMAYALFIERLSDEEE
jgi:uncharacterized protein YrzB (UPF0473 family)